jgi:deoxyadenosine/deoxycytidine kinase
MNSFDLCPVLTLRSDDLDFVNRTTHLDQVVERIQERLSGKEELVI